MPTRSLSPDRLWILTGPLMVLVAVLPVLYWQRRSHVRFRWFAAGAGVWIVGVAIKFLVAAIISIPVYFALGRPTDFNAAIGALGLAWVIVASLISGALTGVFEDGATLLAGLKWRSWVRDPARAAAIGLGAGGIEAVLVSAGVFGLAFALLTFSSLDAATRAAIAKQVPIGGQVWAVPPVERAIAILCHVSSRMLALLTVATGRWRFFLLGFALSTGIDGVAGYMIFAGRIETMSPWLAELMLLPFAVASIPAIIWCYRQWPQPVEAHLTAPVPEASAIATSVREDDTAMSSSGAGGGANGGAAGVSPTADQYSRIQPAWQMVVLSVFTSGLYMIYWYWRNWRDLRAEAGLSISPGWRTVGMLVPILDFFLTLRLFREIGRLASTQRADPGPSPVLLALGYCLLGYFALWISLSTMGASLLVQMLSCTPIIPLILLLIPVQRTFNRYWAAVSPGLPVRTRLSDGEIAMLIVGALLTIAALALPTT